jgi:hypothetical protein
MVREFREETGVVTKWDDWDLVTVLTYKDSVVLFYRAFMDADIKTTTDEEVAWYPTYPLPRDTMRNGQWLIPFCLDTNNYNTLLVREL